MDSNVTPGARERLDAVDKAVLAEAKAAREQDLAIRKSDNDRIVRVEQIRSNDRRDLRERIGHGLAGLAVVAVLLAIVVAIWTGVDRGRADGLQKERLRQETAQACIREGHLWLAGQGCLVANRDVAPAPAAS